MNKYKFKITNEFYQSLKCLIGDFDPLILKNNSKGFFFYHLAAEKMTFISKTDSIPMNLNFRVNSGFFMV